MGYWSHHRISLVIKTACILDHRTMMQLHFVFNCQLLVVYVVCALLPTGLVSHSDLDDRAIEALKEFNEDGALQVLLQFKESDLSHVQV